MYSWTLIPPFSHTSNHGQNPTTFTSVKFPSIPLLNQWHYQDTNSLPCYISPWLLQLPPFWPTFYRVYSPFSLSCMPPAILIHLSVSATPFCQPLHWLPIAQQITFRIPTTYKTIYNSAPSYITNFISKYLPSSWAPYLNFSSHISLCGALGDPWKLIFSSMQQLNFYFLHKLIQAQLFPFESLAPPLRV